MFDFMDMAFDEPIAATDSIGPYIPEASECMRCGMCVGVCPTFKLFQIDEETPRRRVRTISKILVEDQSVSTEERLHLDNCLQCRACEAICPSRMAYGQLYDQAQARLKSAPQGWAKLALRLIENKRRRTTLMPLLALYLKSGLRRPLRSSGLLKKLGVADAEALLTMPVFAPLAGHYPTSVAKRGTVALFTGCVAEHFDRETLSAAIQLLNAIGYEVSIPHRQGCCGAIHQHNGQHAAGLIANNLAVFNKLEVEAVLHTATGCGAMLGEYQSDDGEASELFRQRLADINEFLLRHWPDDLQWLPSSQKVAVHEPCSQRNVLKNQQAVYALLEKIPGLSVVPLADNHLCCGSGGSYMLTHPENAGQLRELKRQAISAAQADSVLSSNFGCAVFLADGSVKVEHPLVFLARHLAEPYSS